MLGIMKTQCRDASASRGGHRKVVSRDQVCDHPTPGSSVCPCGGCSSELGSSSECLQCDHCQKWFCLSCIDLDRSSYRILIRNPKLSAVLAFLCVDCKNVLLPCNASTSASLSAPSISVAEKSECSRELESDSLHEKMRKLEISLSEMKEGYMKCLNESSSVVKTAVVECLDRESFVRRDREKRKRNVVVFGLEENSPPSIQKDRENVIEIFKILEAPIGAFRVYRIGKPLDGRIRPLLVELGGVWERNLLLSRTKRLACFARFRNVFLRADLPVEKRLSFCRARALAPVSSSVVPLPSAAPVSGSGLFSASVASLPPAAAVSGSALLSAPLFSVAAVPVSSSRSVLSSSEPSALSSFSVVDVSAGSAAS